MIREEKIEFTAKWYKYSKYRIAERDGNLYVLPDEQSEPSKYNPFECSNEMLKDILAIGKKVWDNETYTITRELSCEILSKSKEYQQLVLDFTNKYGLIGNFRYLPKNYESIDNKSSNIILEYNKFANKKEFEQRYFGFDNKIDWSKEFDEKHYTSLIEWDNNLRKIKGNHFNYIIFSKYYSETIAEILSFAADIYDQKKVIFEYLYGEATPDIRLVYSDFLSKKSINKVNFGYEVKDGEIKFEWKFDSLRTMIETMLLLNETNGRTEVKLCKHCFSPFIAKNVKAEYDTPQCRNKANIYKSRNKNK